MALFDFLKRKEDIEKAKKAEKKSEQALVAKEKPKKELKKSVKKEKPTAVKGEAVKHFSYQSLKNPHISEKASNLSAANKYVFKIHANTNKTAIKKAVEGMYKVDVASVNVIAIPKKKRRLGRIEGFKKGYKKAIVTIKEGQKIEII